MPSAPIEGRPRLEAAERQIDTPEVMRAGESAVIRINPVAIGPRSCPWLEHGQSQDRRHVAAAAGVSQATVSLMLSSDSGSRFAEETRKRVREAVAALGYRSNAHAKTYREGVAGMIGYRRYLCDHSFCRRHHRGAQQRAWKTGSFC